MQIVQLVPSILDVSRELLRKSRTQVPVPVEDATPDENAGRIARLEENERRQAELINQMAEQLAQLARAVTVLHKRAIWLTAGMSLAIVLAVIAMVK
jgi:phenylpyruvate tautomerase PptA (4-oxalocrotonate tautomerase family)